GLRVPQAAVPRPPAERRPGDYLPAESLVAARVGSADARIAVPQAAVWPGRGEPVVEANRVLPVGGGAADVGPAARAVRTALTAGQGAARVLAGSPVRLDASPDCEKDAMHVGHSSEPGALATGA